MLRLNDLKYSFRLLGKTPFHTSITLIVMVIGLSLYIASYTYAEMNNNKPMPFPNGDRYVALDVYDPLGGLEQGSEGFDLYTYDRLKTSSDSYEIIAAIQFANAIFSDGESYSRQFRSATLSVDFLLATKVNPVLGRLFAIQDATTEAENVVIISYQLWQDYYGGNPNIIGTISRINNQAHNIIGVMPEGFKFPHHENLWLPLQTNINLQPAEGGPVTMVGIIRPEVSRELASAELESLLAQLANEFPQVYNSRTGQVVPYAQWNATQAFNMGSISLILAYVILGLTIVNLSSLFFLRSSSRKHELAMRAALGARGWELAKQVLLESFVICMAGLALSLLISQLILNMMGGVFNTEPFWYVFELNIQSVIMGFVVAIVIWLSSGFFVAYKVWSTPPSSILAHNNKGTGSEGKSNFVQVIVTIEVVLSCFLLLITGVMFALLDRTTVSDYGADTKNTAIASFNLSYLDANDEQDTQQGQLNFTDNLLIEVREVSDITNVAITTAVPGRSGRYGNYQFEAISLNNNEQQPGQETVWVSENYFEVIDVDILEGREFDSNDSASSENVVIIADKFAKQLWPLESALGKRIISTISNEERSLLVVGIISEIIQANTTAQMFYSPSLYRPLAQDTPEHLNLVIKHRPQAVIANLAQAVRLAGVRVDRNVAIENFEPWQVRTGDADTLSFISKTIALGALILAAIGVYAVLSRSIAQRRYEIGIRRALGSTKFNILIHFGYQGLSFLLKGILIGCAPAVLIIAYVLVENFGATDITYLPLVALEVTLLMFFIIALACYIPTSAATRLEPGDALRDD